jgi:hypothetical protein
MEDMDIVSVFYMWISSFPSSTHRRGYLFSSEFLDSFVEVLLAVDA